MDAFELENNCLDPVSVTPFLKVYFDGSTCFPARTPFDDLKKGLGFNVSGRKKKMQIHVRAKLSLLLYREAVNT